mgnify:CR=1 FL=1
MKLFNRKAGNKTINYNGKNVKFVNCVAEVEDDFGKEVLKLGIPDLYEHGKQPVFETPKEVQMKSDFKDREEWYKKEIARLTNVNTANKKKIEELEQRLKTGRTNTIVNTRLVFNSLREPFPQPRQLHPLRLKLS